MSHADVLVWLEPRLVDVPESLANRIREAIASGRWEEGGDRFAKQEGDSPKRPPPSSRLPDALRSIAGELLCDAWSLPSTHDKAMVLLTADALITYACEAVAGADPVSLGELR